MFKLIMFYHYSRIANIICHTNRWIDADGIFEEQNDHVPSCSMGKTVGISLQAFYPQALYYNCNYPIR